MNSCCCSFLARHRPKPACWFSVTCPGPGPLKYHWRNNGLPLTDSWNLSGSTIAVSLGTLTNVGNYDFVVDNP